MGIGVLWGWWVCGGLTCEIWAVFEGGLGDLFFGGSVVVGRSRFPEGMTERKARASAEADPPPAAKDDKVAVANRVAMDRNIFLENTSARGVGGILHLSDI